MWRRVRELARAAGKIGSSSVMWNISGMVEAFRSWVWPKALRLPSRSGDSLRRERLPAEVRLACAVISAAAFLALATGPVAKDFGDREGDLAGERDGDLAGDSGGRCEGTLEGRADEALELRPSPCAGRRIPAEPLVSRLDAPTWTVSVRRLASCACACACVGPRREDEVSVKRRRRRQRPARGTGGYASARAGRASLSARLPPSRPEALSPELTPAPCVVSVTRRVV